MKYLSIKETAARWGISERRIQVLCKENRIPGTITIGRTWGIPNDAEKPLYGLEENTVHSGSFFESRIRGILGIPAVSFL